MMCGSTIDGLVHEVMASRLGAVWFVCSNEPHAFHLAHPPPHLANKPSVVSEADDTPVTCVICATGRMWDRRP